MQRFTRFYGKVAYLGKISDFSTSLRFLFYELISRFQILISVISPSVGPLDFGSGARPPQTDIGSIARNTNRHKDYQPHRVNVRITVCN